MAELAQLEIEGMTCAACQSFIEKTLAATAGVSKASVNLLLNLATIEFDPRVVTVSGLIAAVEKTGYGARTGEAEERPASVLSTWVSLAIGVAMMAAMPVVGHDARWWIWTQLVLALAVMSLAGRPFYVKAWAALRQRRADMNVLIALGTLAAFLLSSFAAIAPHWFHARGMMPQVYFEAVVLILALVLVGKMLEERAKRQTSLALRQLLDLQPKRARVRRGGVEIEIAVEELRRGDELIVLPGDSIAADGEVVEGASSVDESMLTGEGMPVDKLAGAKVFGGTANGYGSLVVRVCVEGGESLLGQIVRVLRAAQGDKAPVQALADRVSAVFVPVVVGVAVLSGLGWAWFGGDAAHAVVVAVAVLVISCPCAMGLAVPTAILAATGRAARNGILIKGGEALERLGEVSVVVLDKTGTITKGAPKVVSVTGDVLRLAASVEARSEHPLARAIVREAAGMELAPVTGFMALPGVGVKGMVEGKRVEVASSEAEGSVRVSIDGVEAGVIVLADAVKESSAAAVARLRKMGLRVVMLTGDREAAARRVASLVGIDEVLAGMLPAAKLEAIAKLQAGGVRVAMVGDGLNDAPALEKADVGIAMARGSDLAIEAGDVALLRGDLDGVAEAIELSRRTMRVMRQNLFWAFLYNVIGIPVAALGLLNPVVAAGAMALSSLSVMLNSLRLR